MRDTIAGGLWLTTIDMVVVFIVLYVLALIIKAIKVVVSPFGGGNGPKGSKAESHVDVRDELHLDAGASEAEAGSSGDLVDAETVTVISAAIAAYLDKPQTALVIDSGNGQRDESPWAMAGRTRIMQSRELAKRRATA